MSLILNDKATQSPLNYFPTKLYAFQTHLLLRTLISPSNPDNLSWSWRFEFVLSNHSHHFFKLRTLSFLLKVAQVLIHSVTWDFQKITRDHFQADNNVWIIIFPAEIYNLLSTSTIPRQWNFRSKTSHRLLFHSINLFNSVEKPRASVLITSFGLRSRNIIP